jgi:hypothetical protein
MVAVAFAPGALSVRQIVFLALGGVILGGTFAPMLPILHRLPTVGAPRVSVALSFEPLHGGPEDLTVSHSSGCPVELDRVLRVGFVNRGPSRVHAALVNVLVPETVEIEASDHKGDTSITHGREMPPTVIDGIPMRFWAEKDVALPVGAILLNYRLSFSDVQALGSEFSIRVSYDADDLHGGERVYERKVRLINLENGG